MNETLVSCVRCVPREKNGSHLNVPVSVCLGDGQAALQLDPRRQRRKKKSSYTLTLVLLAGELIGV